MRDVFYGYTVDEIAAGGTFMSNSSLIQIRVDDELKKEVTDIYEQLGLDLPTAIRMFLKKSVVARGLPFDATLQNRSCTMEKE